MEGRILQEELIGMTNLSVVKQGGDNTPECPLDHLPCSVTKKFRKGEIIYRQGDISAHLYLLIDGKVKFLRETQKHTRPFLIDIYDADSFFGESSLLSQQHADSAV